MKKIVGILSMQRVINYGSFLQAYALKKMIKEVGATEVHFIDIKKGRQLELPIKETQLERFKRILSIIFSKKIITKIKDKHFNSILTKKFKTEYYKLLELDKTPPPHFDLVIIGSDEVFNCCQVSSWGFTTQLYGDIKADKIISYAGSFGHTTYENIIHYNLDKEISNALTNIKNISVRDENSHNIIFKLTTTKPTIHLDPVLLYDFSTEIGKCQKPHLDNYIVVYSYQERINSPEEIKAITSFAKKHNKILVSIFCRYDWCDKAIIPSTPFDVITWFSHADYTITDTFHGTIFSIITQRKFVTFIRSTNNQKISFLLNNLNLRNRTITSANQLSTILNQDIDYKPTLDIIASNRKLTKSYLSEALCSNQTII